MDLFTEYGTSLPIGVTVAGKDHFILPSVREDGIPQLDSDERVIARLNGTTVSLGECLASGGFPHEVVTLDGATVLATNRRLMFAAPLPPEPDQIVSTSPGLFTLATNLLLKAAARREVRGQFVVGTLPWEWPREMSIDEWDKRPLLVFTSIDILGRAVTLGMTCRDRPSLVATGSQVYDAIREFRMGTPWISDKDREWNSSTSNLPEDGDGWSTLMGFLFVGSLEPLSSEQRDELVGRFYPMGANGGRERPIGVPGGLNLVAVVKGREEEALDLVASTAANTKRFIARGGALSYLKLRVAGRSGPELVVALGNTGYFSAFVMGNILHVFLIKATISQVAVGPIGVGRSRMSGGDQYEEFLGVLKNRFASEWGTAVLVEDRWGSGGLSSGDRGPGPDGAPPLPPEHE